MVLRKRKHRKDKVEDDQEGGTVCLHPKRTSRRGTRSTLKRETWGLNYSPTFIKEVPQGILRSACWNRSVSVFSNSITRPKSRGLCGGTSESVSSEPKIDQKGSRDNDGKTGTSERSSEKKGVRFGGEIKEKEPKTIDLLDKKRLLKLDIFYTIRTLG